ncbi:MAG: hypothetical protein AB7H43_01290 [Acidimicrobiia bacterium]
MSTDLRTPGPSIWVLFLAGPVLWFGHFMAVYLLAEAACAADVFDGDLLGLSVLSTVTLAATAAAVVVTLVTTVLAYRRWRAAAGRDDWVDVTDRNAGLAFAGFILGVVFIAAIGFVGVPAAFLEPC